MVIYVGAICSGIQMLHDKSISPNVMGDNAERARWLLIHLSLLLHHETAMQRKTML